MSEPKSIPREFADYLTRVCEQVRWKKAHSSVRRELSDHMEDQMAAYLSHGVPPEEAVQKTVREMGDPIQVGTQLDRAYRPKTDKGLLLAAILLMIGGWILQAAYFDVAVLPVSYLKMAAAAVLGICGMLAAMRADYTFWALDGKTGIAVYVLYFVVIFILPVKWLLTYNPYSLYSLCVYLFALFPLVLCGIVYFYRGRGFRGFLICGGITAVSLLFMAVAYSGASLLISFPCLAVLILAMKMDWFGISSNGKKKAAYTLLFGIPAAVFCFLIVSGWRRISIVLDPYTDNGTYVHTYGYSYIAVRSALASSRLFGPAALPDAAGYIFPRTADTLIAWGIARFGWWILFIIIPLAVLLCLKGFAICRKQRGSLGRMVSCAVAVTLTAQVFFYIQANLGGVFIIPYPFPFLQGNLSTVVNFVLLGFLLSAGQRECLDEDLDYEGRKTVPAGKFPVSFNVRRSGRQVDFNMKVRLPERKQDCRKNNPASANPEQ